MGKVKAELTCNHPVYYERRLSFPAGSRYSKYDICEEGGKHNRSWCFKRILLPLRGLGVGWFVPDAPNYPRSFGSQGAYRAVVMVGKRYTAQSHIVDFLHHENPPTWAGVKPEILGIQGQRQTNYAKPNNGRSSLGVMVTDLWPVCHEFSSPSATEDPTRRAADGN
ncbi:hypothetical protein TNCV_3090951 [Trichonephila clavipes]|uniref:Uncharacterized protein n=1 Tax=Trichonephila clavipes TaxID=2585209 RepID=A0A8X6W8A5_TRICX|nr:hypothetical protein TNCV_3090951 [Trichonephila clavipes]